MSAPPTGPDRKRQFDEAAMSQHPATRLVRSALTGIVVACHRLLPGILMALGATFGVLLDPASHGMGRRVRSGTIGNLADEER